MHIPGVYHRRCLGESIAFGQVMAYLLALVQSSQFVQFAYLQALDLLSTIAFLLHGAGEANPFVRWSMQTAPNPVAGLALAKMIGLSLALYCVHAQRERVLSRMNLFYAGLIAWNLVCLILAYRF